MANGLAGTAVYRYSARETGRDVMSIEDLRHQERLTLLTPDLLQTMQDMTAAAVARPNSARAAVLLNCLKTLIQDVFSLSNVPEMVAPAVGGEPISAERVASFNEGLPAKRNAQERAQRQRKFGKSLADAKRLLAPKGAHLADCRL